MIELALLLLGPLLAPWTGPDDALDRILDKALARAQPDILRSAELYEDHSTWETAWRVQSDHYEVRTTDSRLQGHDVAQGMEAMLGLFRGLLDVRDLPSERMLIYIFPGIPEYNAFGNGEGNGAEHSSFYTSFFAEGHPAQPVATFQSSPVPLRMQITHGIFHQWLAKTFSSQVPTWVEEGLASFFTVSWAYSWGVDQLERIKSNGYVPFRRLLSEGLDRYGDDAHARLIELAMLFNYLHYFREDTRQVVENGVVVSEPFAEYLRKVVRGRDLSGDPVHALLTRDRNQLERDFLEFDRWQ